MRKGHRTAYIAVLYIHFCLVPCTRLYGIKYSYPIQIISKQIYLCIFFLHNVRYQVSLSNTNNFQTDLFVGAFFFDLFHTVMLYQVSKVGDRSRGRP